ncbi:transposase, partial [Streptomyces sp. NPDC056503]|uniref:transposase n=1 Tax=Streptomyces sp. NPDC056503 TaxID=3345842 RepID=UPI003690D89E
MPRTRRRTVLPCGLIAGGGLSSTDAQRKRAGPLLPERTPKRGGRWRDRRRGIDVIAFEHRTGMPRMYLPERFGPRSGVHDRPREAGRGRDLREGPCHRAGPPTRRRACQHGLRRGSRTAPREKRGRSGRTRPSAARRTSGAPPSSGASTSASNGAGLTTRYATAAVHLAGLRSAALHVWSARRPEGIGPAPLSEAGPPFPLGPGRVSDVPTRRPGDGAWWHPGRDLLPGACRGQRN